jgi:tRNA modification GTPase
MKILDNNDTIISPISSTLGGSVNLIRISGPNAIQMADRYFSNKNLMNEKGGQFFFGKLINQQTEIIDDIVLLLYKAPHSYTGEDVIEISCHGNAFIVDQILELFLSVGCRMSEPGEYTKRAFLNGKMDLVQAEAVADLISAKSRSLVKFSLDNLNGKLSKYIIQIKDQIINTASLLELDLDFNEENLNIVTDVQVKESLKAVIQKIEHLLKSYELGKVLNKGIEVLITGKPNVGKSSLMNALLEKNRVIVSSTPGTTRDTIHEDIIINNIMVRFIDTAGIHITEDQIEAEGVNRAKCLFEHANIILLVIDGSEELEEEDHNLIKSISSIYAEKLMILLNKSDLKKNNSTNDSVRASGVRNISISALKNDKIDFLKNEITSRFKNVNNNIQEDQLVTNQRQVNILIKIKESLESATNALDAKLGFEFISIDLRNAIDHLSEITGEISTDDILNNIFSSFCIGK